MKLLLIKIGKAFSTLRREGFLKGGKRIIDASRAMFNRVESGNMLFITGGVGDSALYRAHHVAEELEMHGFKCSITVQDNPWLATYSDKFKVFIFHRVLCTASVKKLIEKIKNANKEIIFETDDLVYDPQYLKFMDYYQQMNVFEKKLYENGVGGEILRDSYVRVCTTSTSYLADELRKYNKKTFVVSNKLSNKDLEIIRKITDSQLPRNDNKIKIGYFSGTFSHNRDFATITGALAEIMKKYSRVELHLFGPLEIENELKKFENRIKKQSYAPRAEHFKNISLVDINLAPLEINNPFCESKSELKFFEAGILGVPTIAAATRTFRETIIDGVDGFTASTQKEWIEKMENLIINEKLRKKVGEKALQKSFENYTNKNSHNEDYYNYLRSILTNLK